ncbi:MerR family transcriptional regulator, partial [bacterium]|nr:MerR family transcriptional regulator [bacterium]
METKPAPVQELCGTSAPEQKTQLELNTVVLDEDTLEANETIALDALPEGKKYFRIGEVASLLKVEAYVLRYWESEFKTIKPVKAGSGH